MYSWLWRKMPFNVYINVLIYFVVLVIATLFLWEIVFPWIDGLLPVNDVQVH